LSNASSNHAGDNPVALAIAAFSKNGDFVESVSPCGNCRQMIIEEESRNGKNIRIILGGKFKVRIIENGGDLLPLQFNSDNLKVNPH
jgi:cytidine deaminase